MFKHGEQLNKYAMMNYSSRQPLIIKGNNPFKEPSAHKVKMLVCENFAK